MVWFSLFLVAITVLLLQGGRHGRLLLAHEPVECAHEYGSLPGRLDHPHALLLPGTDDEAQVADGR